MTRLLLCHFANRLQVVLPCPITRLFGLAHSRWAWIVLLLLFNTAPLHAQNLPFVNTGIASFVDGMPAPRGLKFQEFFVFATADKINDSKGNEISGLPDVDLFVYASQIVYTPEKNVPLINAQLDLTVVQLFVLDELKFDANGTGIGDMFIGPAFQWDPIVVDGKPVFAHRLELDAIIPVGQYNANRLTNPSSNFFSFNPYWAATFLLTERWAASTRLHYLWNAPNDDPNKVLFPGAGSTQAGQAFHMNFASSYSVTRPLRVGLAGYYLRQFTDSKVDGKDVTGTRQEVLGVGPGMFYEFSQGIMVMNAYADLFSKNRIQGMLVVWRIAFKF